MIKNRLSHLNNQEILIAVSILVLLILLFMLTPWTGDDWGIYHGAARRVLARENLYETKITFGYFYNPPWVAVAFAPLALLPEKFGWAVVCAASLIVILALLRRWEPRAGVIKIVLALLSPPTMYILLHGQIDALVLGLVMLPSDWWVLVAATKPQITFGLIAGISLDRWQRIALITIGVMLVSVVLFGLWPLDVTSSPRPFQGEGHNIWLNLWPFQVPVGVALIVAGWSLGQAPNERLLLAATPFLSPYAAMSSLIGPWLVGLTYMTTLQSVLVWLSWWGAVVYRAVIT